MTEVAEVTGSIEETLVVSRTDHVLEMSIARPAVRNAIDLATARAIAVAVDELDDDDQLRVGIITGIGGTFCAGMDLKAFARGELPKLEGRGFAGIVQKPPKKPLIAAVEGVAVGGGCEIALSCDVIIAGRGASFGLPEVSRGLAARGGGLLRLGQRIPFHVAMELVLTGEFVNASRAYQLGLVNKVVPNGEALTAAHTVARRIAANGPLAVVASKQVLMQAANWTVAEGFERQDELLDPVFNSEDAKEGPRAFAERRKPRFEGR